VVVRAYADILPAALKLDVACRGSKFFASCPTGVFLTLTLTSPESQAIMISREPVTA
jgi:hypothetical protein